METVVPYESLDDGIREAVRVLAQAGVETFESCQGGDGHAYPEPTGPCWEMVILPSKGK